MRKDSLATRVSITMSLLVAGTVLFHTISHGERIPLHHALQDFPSTLGGWVGQDRPLESRIVKAAGVDDYLSRIYTHGQEEPVALYVGYYQSQRTGDTIHSPKNCLPGTGWEPVRAGRMTIQVPDFSPILVNEYVVQKGLDQQLVVYWYQSRGRVVASEYWGKVWQVVDAITRNRTDGALVRVLTPTRDGEERAHARAVEFVRLIYPRLGQFLPN